MRNIIRIFLSDFRRLSTNVVAVVIIMGLSVIPSLYAWFNIFSNWAPYDEDATGRLSVAIVSNDEGIEIEGYSINVGDIILDHLKENKSIHWVFPKNDTRALDGVRSGKYYAAFVIEDDFTVNMVSFIGGDAKHPEITYYENEKKNAIAPKITGKVKTAIQEEVNKSFVSTLVKVALQATAGVDNQITSSDLGGTATDRLTIMNNDLSTCISVVDTYISLIESTQGIMDATSEVASETDLLKESIATLSDTASSTIDSADTTVDATSDLISVNMDDIESDLGDIEQEIDRIFSSADKATAVTNAELETVELAFSNLKTKYETMRTQLQNIGISESEDVKTKADTVVTDFTTIEGDIAALRSLNTSTVDDAQTIYNTTKSDISTCLTDVRTLSTGYKNTVSPQLANSLDSVKASVNDVNDMLNYGDTSIAQVVGILSSYPDMLSLGSDKLSTTRDDLVAMQTQLEELIVKVDGVDDNEQIAMLRSLLQTDPEAVSEFVTSPVDIKTDALYPIKNNGSAMAPFYIVLSIWVGSLILVAIIHTKVANPVEFENLKNYQEFFGRYITFFLIGQIQTVITVLGALLFVGIQCKHPFMLYFAMAVTSLCYTLIMYSLTYAFDSVGEAVCVVLMVIQVAGSGGTFPIEVLPRFYQVLYKYMPFAYSVNAARECVAGIYGNAYWGYLMSLCTWIAVSLFIGLVCSIPCRKLMVMIKESTEMTELLI